MRMPPRAVRDTVKVLGRVAALPLTEAGTHALVDESRVFHRSNATRTGRALAPPIAAGLANLLSTLTPEGGASEQRRVV